MSIQQASLPSFKEQYAVVYNDYMGTLGGGERSSLAFALALQKLDFQVEIVSTRELPDTADIVKIFGDEFATIPMRRIKTRNISKYLKNSELSVFVNHTYMSFHPNPAKLGIYALMFPNTPVSRYCDRVAHANLQTYKRIVCNSSFTRNYLKGYWEYPDNQSVVLNPPLGERLTNANSKEAILAKKEKVILHIGRFNPGNHNKNQQLIINAFLEATQKYAEMKDWRLVLVGNVNRDAASQAYHQQCVDMITNSHASDKIEIRSGLNNLELEDYLERAFAYVHATGAFLAPGLEPHRCEHFGLGIAEAMAFGAIPLVYARGGIFDVLSPGENGLVYLDRQGLIDGLLELTAIYNDPQTSNRFQGRCMDIGQTLSHDRFTQKLAGVISEGLFGK